MPLYARGTQHEIDRLTRINSALLEALEDALTAYGTELHMKGYANEIIESDPFVQKARAAIAQARGGKV